VKKKLKFLFPLFLREVDVWNMGRFFLLLHNIEVECLLCILYGFPAVGRDCKICNTAGK